MNLSNSVRLSDKLWEKPVLHSLFWVTNNPRILQSELAAALQFLCATHCHQGLALHSRRPPASLNGRPSEVSFGPQVLPQASVRSLLPLLCGILSSWLWLMLVYLRYVGGETLECGCGSVCLQVCGNEAEVTHEVLFVDVWFWRPPFLHLVNW